MGAREMNDAAAPAPEGETAEPVAWPREWRSALRVAIETLDSEADMRLEGGHDSDARKLRRAMRVLSRMLSGHPAPESPEATKKALQDWPTLYTWIMRGIMYKPTFRDLVGLYGETPNGEEALHAEIARLRCELEFKPKAGLRDAYEGAREDLLDWKGRAQRAEAELRRLGYKGIDASEKPEAGQREGVGALAHIVQATLLRTYEDHEDCRITTTLIGDMAQAVARRLASAQQQQCCMCGRCFDAREQSEGGGSDGAQLTDGRWTCSPGCWERASAQQAGTGSRGEVGDA